ncbi:alpha/beta fold hydrolase [Egibacter rhizosphaerae]|uniref:Alpha/beta fold hydrolase n=1 Tax=Egibacter rhizosphaerae TaxID=1670831 RepID=A0A411YAN4_9ACTN|nr:alpha/beta fold hydrolase [Egibacter rhizosphaerae]QBI18280.1 alpha/beta fold hydrolase [Egibacter rhizosphaerae]
MGSSVATVEFCRLADGSRVAYATVGHGPALVMLPGWLCHLEESWAHPAAASARAKFAGARRFVWYDRLGCGLSDREGFEPSLDNDVDQLVAVLDAAGIDRADLIGYSFGAPPAAVFAARYPERVDRLVCYSAFARGTAISTAEGSEALKHLIRLDWGLGSRALASRLVPNASSRDLAWFDRFQRTAASAETACRLLDHQWTMDVREALPAIRAPTLVLHNRDDRAVPLSAGQEIAALVPGAELRVLDGNEHDPFIRDSGSVVESILAFVDGRPQPAEAAPPPPGVVLTPREREVLVLIARGAANKRIATTLGVTLATVERHVTNLYRKLDANGRADAVLAAVDMGLVSPTR